MPFIVPAIAAIVEVGALVGSFITSLGVVGTGLIAAGIGIASTYLISAMSPKPASDVTQGGVNFERQYGTQVPRQVACGLVGLAGHDTYVNTYNPSNRTLQQIYTLSDYYTTALTRVAIGGVWVIIGPDIGDGKGNILMPTTAEQTWSGSIWVKFFDGRQTAADGFLTAFSNPVGRWAADCIGIGESFVSVLVEYDKDHNNSYPDFFFEFKGAPIYDWRKDSTNGGSGSHRWNNVATHEYSANPILIERHYRRGFSVNGDLFCGMDMQESDLPVAKWTPAASVCDEIDVDDGLPRYEVSIILNSMQPHTSNLQSLALSCGSMQIDSVDGSWPLVGTDQPVVITFTDDDLISVADVEFQRYKSMGELVNSVSGNYPEPDQLWSMVGYNEQIATAFLAVDRRTRDLAIDFPMVRLARQAAQLAYIYLYENRFEITATVTLRPRFQSLEEGDWVTWNSEEYGTFTYIITSKSLRSLESDGPRNVVLKLQQRDGGIYSGITPVPIVFPTPNDGPVYLAEVQSFGIVAVNVQGALGRALPAIRASWTPTIPVDVTITAIELIYYPTAQPGQVLTKTVPADRSVAILDSGVVSNTNYTVQAKIITNPSRVTVFNAGANVTTSNILVGTVDVDAAILYNITILNDLFNDRLAEVEAKIASVSSNLGALSFTNTKRVENKLSDVVGAISASISHVSEVSTGENAARVLDIFSLFAGTNSGTGMINVTAQSLSSLSGSFSAYQITVGTTYATIVGLNATNALVSANAIAISGITGSLANYVLTVTASATYATIGGSGAGSLATTNANVTVNASAVALLNGYAGAQYSITLDVNGYGVGFNLINGGGGIGAAVFTVPKFQIASPGVSGGAAVPIFTVGNVAGSPKIGIRADMYIDGTITASNAIIAGTITGSLIQALAINTAALAINGVDILNIIPGAVTNEVSLPFSASGSIPAATTQSIISGSATIKGGTAGVQFCAEVTGLNSNTSGFDWIVYRLFVDGVAKRDWRLFVETSSTFTGASGVQWSPRWRVGGLSNGLHTFEVKKMAGGTSSSSVGDGDLIITDLRR